MLSSPATFSLLESSSVKPGQALTVGVAVPSYLGAGFIGRTLKSLLDQTYPHWYCVVVNDGDEDGTQAVVAALRDGRIRYVSDGRRRGQFANFNKAIIEVLKRDPAIVRLLCADDVLYPHDLGDMVRVFATYDKVGLVATHFDGMDDSDKTIFTSDMRGREDLVMAGSEYLVKGVAVGNTIGGPSSVAIRREAIETAGLFDTRVNHSGESDLWHRVAACWDIAWVGQRTGLRYRIHAASITGRGQESVAKFTDPIQLVRRVASTCPLFSMRWWAHQYTIGRLHAINFQLLLAHVRRRNWRASRAMLKGALREGMLVYAPFWVPRIPWQIVRRLAHLDPSTRVVWHSVHQRLQPSQIPVASSWKGDGRKRADQGVASGNCDSVEEVR